MKSTVLAFLVNTDSMTRLTLQRALASENCEVVWAATLEEAVEASDRCHIDLVLLDLDRPLRLGWDIFERVTVHNPAAPVVILTGKKTEFEVAAARQVGALLEKPINTAELIETINVLLARPAQQLSATAKHHEAHAQTQQEERKP